VEKEEEMVNFGLWSEPGVPHIGWVCETIYDNEYPTHVCQMCLKQQVRYVHVMSHVDHPVDLYVGCVCSGRMSEDYRAAKEREANLKKKGRANNKWVRSGWKKSQKGFIYKNSGKYNYTIVAGNGGGYTYLVRDRGVEKSFRYSANFEDPQQAMKASFEAFLILNNRKSL
jgi:hypothetical protein